MVVGYNSFRTVNTQAPDEHDPYLEKEQQHHALELESQFVTFGQPSLSSYAEDILAVYDLTGSVATSNL